MNRKFLMRLAAIIFVASLSFGMLSAQSSQSSSAAPDAQQAHQATEQGSNDNANEGVGEILAATTEKAAHTAEKWGRVIGVGPKTSFGISVGFNFIVLFLFFYVLLKSRLPQAFRERTLMIQKGIRDAQEASADATRRLGDIETRLGKLDAEIAEIRKAAEGEAAAEEERIRKAAEEDKQKVVTAAETEIDAIARNARRELKGYAASLAVDLAARQLRVDESTDHALVREFAEQLGKDGR